MVNLLLFSSNVAGKVAVQKQAEFKSINSEFGKRVSSLWDPGLGEEELKMR